MSNHKNPESMPFVVCGTCAGNGTTGPGWVYTSEDRDEMGYEWDDHMQDMRAGRFDVVCSECNGQRVVRSECECDECESDRRELADMYAMERMERMYGC